MAMLLYVIPLYSYIILFQNDGHRIVRKREDVCWSHGIVAGSECGGTAVTRDVDRQAIPPLLRLIRPTFVILYLILNQH